MPVSPLGPYRETWARSEVSWRSDMSLIILYKRHMYSLDYQTGRSIQQDRLNQLCPENNTPACKQTEMRVISKQLYVCVLTTLPCGPLGPWIPFGPKSPGGPWSSHKHRSPLMLMCVCVCVIHNTATFMSWNTEWPQRPGKHEAIYHGGDAIGGLYFSSLVLWIRTSKWCHNQTCMYCFMSVKIRELRHTVYHHKHFLCWMNYFG